MCPFILCLFAKGAVGEGIMKTIGQSAAQKSVEKRLNESDSE
jgi:hypothetical protein